MEERKTSAKNTEWKRRSAQSAWKCGELGIAPTLLRIGPYLRIDKGLCPGDIVEAR
jgi:hypothetical protein